MFNIGDRVLHKSGISGTVIGYGHQIVDSVYLPTLMVKLTDANSSQINIVEDLSSVWSLLEQQDSLNFAKVYPIEPVANYNSQARLAS